MAVMGKGIRRRGLLSALLLLPLLFPAPPLSAQTTAPTPPAAPAAAPTIVKVGAYEFPPYVAETGGGVTGAFVALLNEEQKDYRFEIVPTSPQRRFGDLARGQFDIIAFESRDWGWQKIPVTASRVFLDDGEVFVAKAAPGVDQRYFDSLQGKSIMGRLGYHYAFAGYDADPGLLARRYNARLTVTHEGNVRSVIAGRADLAIVTKSYLVQLLRRNPSLAPQLLVSERMDQRYEHTILVRPGAPVEAAWINKLLDRLDANGKLAALWKSQGIIE